LVIGAIKDRVNKNEGWVFIRNCVVVAESITRDDGGCHCRITNKEKEEMVRKKDKRVQTN